MIYFILPVHKNFSDCVKFINKTSENLEKYKINFLIVNTFRRNYFHPITSFKLGTNHKVNILQGKSRWYWFKSIHNGLKLLAKEVSENDTVILSNVDVLVPKNYIENITMTHRLYPGCIIGSQLRNLKNSEVIDHGPKVTENFFIKSITEDEIEYFSDGNTYGMDFVSGRGMIFQGHHVKDLLQIKSYLAQHYFSDYLISLSMVKMGYKNIMTRNIYLFSEEAFGNSNTSYNPINLFFSKKNPQLLPASFTFFYVYSKIYKGTNLILFTLFYAVYLVDAFKRVMRKKLESKWNG